MAGGLVAVMAVIGLLIAVLAILFPGTVEYRTLAGPVAIQVRGSGPSSSNPPAQGFLGVRYESTPNGTPRIARVTKGSGAAKAGLTKGDVIIAVNGVKTPDRLAVARALENTSPGQNLKLTVKRGEREIEVTAQMIAYSDLLDLQAQDDADSP